MLEIILAPNEILRGRTKRVKKITPYYLNALKEMVQLASAFIDPEGVGLAAPQVGISEQFFIAKLENRMSNHSAKKSSRTIAKLENHSQENSSEFIAIFNPKILFYSKRTKKFLEGCLSIPDYYGEVTRPTMVKVQYQNKQGGIISETLKGINAMIFQHEYDHLIGKLFIDYVMEQKSRLFKITGKDKTGADIFEEVTV